ncbi:hypothetical protein T484DRAFT_1959260 [Baffinella frigidus]|nr:hypothetical protein T484DRAFT_1959260 [Cryptophyta sp. CCMP2293]
MRRRCRRRPSRRGSRSQAYALGCRRRERRGGRRWGGGCLHGAWAAEAAQRVQVKRSTAQECLAKEVEDGLVSITAVMRARAERQRVKTHLGPRLRADSAGPSCECPQLGMQQTGDRRHRTKVPRGRARVCRGRWREPLDIIRRR